LTILAEQEFCQLTLLPPGEKEQSEPEPVRGDVQEKTLKGLHAAFFQNRLFWEFIESSADPSMGVVIDSPEACKKAFKKLAGVESCRELSESYVCDMIKDFNKFLNQRGR
jgi:hypothetical protein